MTAKAGTRRMSYASEARLTFALTCLAAAFVIIQLGLQAAETLQAARSERAALERLTAMPQAAAPDEQQPVAGIAVSTDAAGAGALLQDAVNRSAEAHGLKIENLQLLEPRRSGALTRIALRVNGTIPEQSALPFLAELSGAMPAITATTVELQRVPEMALLAEGEQPTERLLAIRLELGAIAAISGSAAAP